MAFYSYDGPVLIFGKLVADHWKSQTKAPTEAKAKSNLAYQYKRDNRLMSNSLVSLPGKVKYEGE